MAIRVIKKDDLDAFREYLKTEEKSRGTIEKYCRDMKMVFEWLGFEEVTKEKLVEWKKALIDSGKAVTTVNSMIAALNTFLKSMKWEDLKIKSIKVQKQFFVRDDRKLSKKEYEALIKTAYAKGNDRLVNNPAQKSP